jgi:uncharacterized damage-inducible protein DinB
MDALRHVRLMADYNRWMNRAVYDAAATLPDPVLARDAGAFFGSILGTLNHLAVADALWLRRFEAAGHWGRLRAAVDWLPDPRGLREPLADDLAGLRALRERLDALIVDWCDELVFNDLDRVLAYRNTSGQPQHRQLGPLLSHFFNHQTHHRGQVTTLLSQCGVDPGATDLIAMPGFDPFNRVAAGTTDRPAVPASLAAPAARPAAAG